MTKLEVGAHHRRPLTELVERKERIWEMRVGRTNIARVFWCHGPERQLIVMLCRYIKQRQALDPGELARARGYKRDLERRAG